MVPIAITIPEINSGVTIEHHNATVSVTKEGDMFLNGNPVTEDSLSNDLIALKDSLEVPELVVKADESVRSSKIMDIMNAAQDAEYKKLIVAGEPLSKKEQNKLKNHKGK